jgi:hypothetical protein
MIQPMFLPTLKGTLYKGLTFNARGKETPSNPVPIRYTAIRTKLDVNLTSIRTDKSASQGRAEELVYDGRILVHPEVKPEEGQIVTLVDGKTYTIEVVQDIRESIGTIDHYQVDLLL